MNVVGKYRRRTPTQQLIALSISSEVDNLLRRGLGHEHLQELLVRLARPLLRGGAGLAYGGDWEVSDHNFTYDLLRLISAEQEDNSAGGPDAKPIGRLVNHLAWPHYLKVTPRIEAQWINCCRIVRISQELAGIAPGDWVADTSETGQQERVIFNSAIAVSHMRRLANLGMPSSTQGEIVIDGIPPVSARILLGGKVTGFSGFVPGLFEEALLALETDRPLYVLGGFGGAAETIANALLTSTVARPNEFEPAWQESRTPKVATLRALESKFPLPPGMRNTQALLNDLYSRVVAARGSLAMVLKTGLDEIRTRELMTTRDVRRVVALVLDGLVQQVALEVRTS